MTETRKLADHFHDVYENSYIVLKEDAMDLLPDNIKYMHRGSLIFIPVEEKEKLLSIDPVLENKLQMRQQMSSKKPFMGPKNTANKYLLTQMDSSNKNTPKKTIFVNTNGQMRQQMGNQQIKIYLDRQDIDEILRKQNQFLKEQPQYTLTPSYGPSLQEQYIFSQAQART